MMLVIDKKDSTIAFQTGCLLIEQPGESRRRIPVKQLEVVIIYGAAMVSAAAWRGLAAAGVPAILLASRGEQTVALLGAGLATQLPLRRMQHRCADDPACSARVAAWFVRRKLYSYRPLTELCLEWMGDEAAPRIESYAAAVDSALQALDEATEVSTVMGIEGYVARTWFQLLADILPEQWKFGGRNRRPPRDPVNAMLSLGYTLLWADVRHQLIAYGLDPALGFLHQDYPGREGLVLDYCEPWRSGVDAMVLALIQEGVVRPEDFYYREKEGCRLSKQARPMFYQAWAKQREAWPRWHGGHDSEDGADPAETGRTAPLRQQLGGMVQAFRQQLTEQEEKHG